MNICAARHDARSAIQGRAGNISDDQLALLARRLYVGPLRGAAWRIAADRDLAGQIEEMRNVNRGRQSQSR